MDTNHFSIPSIVDGRCQMIWAWFNLASDFCSYAIDVYSESHIGHKG